MTHSAPGVRERALRQYRRNQIETAKPGQLLLMVYYGILSCLGSASRALTPPEGEQKDMEAASKHLLKAQRLLEELQLSVDDSAEELGPMLEQLYEVLMAQLRQANVNKDVELIVAIGEQFAGLRDAWAQVVEVAGKESG